MKKLIALFAASIMIAISANVMAQNTATESANATARIINPLKINNTSDLAFGSIVNDDNGGTVVISPDGSRELNLGLSALPSNTEKSAASYDISGDPDAFFTLTLPGSISIATSTDEGAPSMTVDNFTTTVAKNEALDYVGQLNDSGTLTIKVGATLNVNALQASGTYTGTYDVIVAYN